MVETLKKGHSQFGNFSDTHHDQKSQAKKNIHNFFLNLQLSQFWLPTEGTHHISIHRQDNLNLSLWMKSCFQGPLPNPGAWGQKHWSIQFQCNVIGTLNESITIYFALLPGLPLCHSQGMSCQRGIQQGTPLSNDNVSKVSKTDDPPARQAVHDQTCMWTPGANITQQGGGHRDQASYSCNPTGQPQVCTIPGCGTEILQLPYMGSSPMRLNVRLVPLCLPYLEGGHKCSGVFQL